MHIRGEGGAVVISFVLCIVSTVYGYTKVGTHVLHTLTMGSRLGTYIFRKENHFFFFMINKILFEYTTKTVILCSFFIV